MFRRNPKARDLAPTLLTFRFSLSIMRFMVTLVLAATFDHIRSIHVRVFDSTTCFSGSFQSENLSKSINSLENLLNAKVCWFLNPLILACKIFLLGVIGDSLYVKTCHTVLT